MIIAHVQSCSTHSAMCITSLCTSQQLLLLHMYTAAKRLLALVNSLLLTLKFTYYIGSMVLNRQSLGTGLMVLHTTHLSLVVQPISTIAVRVILSNEVQHLQSLYYEEAGQ